MSTTSKSGRIEIRVSEEERRLETAAASELGQTLSEFVRQSARARAEEVLRDRGRVTLGSEAAARFLAALDGDGEPPDGLRDLFVRPAFE